MNIRFLLLSILASGLVGGAAAGQTGSQVTTEPVELVGGGVPYRIVYDHVADRTTLEAPNGELLEEWDRYAPTTPLTEIPPGRSMTVEIRNANPLLYDYNVRAEIVRAEPLKTCNTLGSRAAAQGFALGAMAVGGGMLAGLDLASTSGGSVDITSLLPIAEAITEPGTRGVTTKSATMLTEAMLEQQLAAVRAPVIAYTAYTTTLTRLALTIEDSLARFASIGETAPLEAQLDRFQQHLEQIQPGLSIPTRVPQLIQARASESKGAVGTVRGLAAAVDGDNFAGDPMGPTARETRRLARRVEEGATTLQETYPKLQHHLLRIRQVKGRTNKVFALAPGREAVRRLVIEIEANDDYEDVLRLHEGEVTFYTRPRQKTICEISVGAAWLASLPSYGIDGEGHLVDEETSEYRIAPNLMVHIATSRFPVLAGTFGVGIGADRTPDFYLGGGLRPMAPLVLNFGVVWQRTQQLPDNLSIGRPVADPSALDNLDKRYRPAVFFSINLAR